jgi:putative ABC transport system permease protein
MSVIKRAILYLTRKKNRAVILLLSFFVLSVFSMTFLSVSSAVSQELKNLEASFASSFTCQINNNHVKEAVNSDNFDDLNAISDSDLNILHSINGIRCCYTHYTPFGNIWVNLDTGDEYHNELNAVDNLLPSERQNNEYQSQALQGSCFFGCYNSDMHEYFRTGAFQLIEGRHIQPDDKYAVVISDVLAGRNDLSVGDTFTAKALNFTSESTKELIEAGLENTSKLLSEYTTYGNLELEIVGIYSTSIPSNHLGIGWSNIQNTVFSDVYSAKLLDELYWAGPRGEEPNPDDDGGWYDFVTVFVDDPKNMDNVIEEVRATGIVPEKYYDLTIDTDAYDAAAKPLQVLRGFSIALVAICVAACCIIAGLLSSMWTKTRRKEIGVLIALGNSRGKILFQLFSEMIILCIIALLLALIVTMLILGPVGALANSAFSPDEDTEQFYWSLDGYLKPVLDIRGSEPINLTYYLTAVPVAITAGILLFASLISVFASSFRIMKLRPRDIFSKW